MAHRKHGKRAHKRAGKYGIRMARMKRDAKGRFLTRANRVHHKRRKRRANKAPKVRRHRRRKHRANPAAPAANPKRHRRHKRRKHRANKARKHRRHRKNPTLNINPTPNKRRRRRHSRKHRANKGRKHRHRRARRSLVPQLFRRNPGGRSLKEIVLGSGFKNSFHSNPYSSVAGFGVGIMDTALVNYMARDALGGNEVGGLIVASLHNIITPEIIGMAGKKMGASSSAMDAFVKYHKAGGWITIAFNVASMLLAHFGSASSTSGIGYSLTEFANDIKTGKWMQALKLPMLKGLGLDIHLPKKLKSEISMEGMRGATPDKYGRGFIAERPMYGATGGQTIWYEDAEKLAQKERDLDNQLRSFGINPDALGTDVSAMDDLLTRSSTSPMGGTAEQVRKAGML